MCTSSPSGPDVTLLVDLSKNLITESVPNNPLALAREAKVEETRDKMLAGERINTSEDRAVLSGEWKGYTAAGKTIDVISARPVTDPSKR